MTEDLRLSRRHVLATAGAGMAVCTATPTSPAVAVPVGQGRARFLDRGRLRTLRALVDRVVPGAEEDGAPGAVTARCHRAIDSLLGAFTVTPPLIYAGAPFSDRGGSRTNHFADFLRLDDYEETAWRLRIEGSRGRRGLERNGPVVGYQRTYRRGLRVLEDSVPGGFSEAPAAVRDVALRRDDPVIRGLLDLAVPHTLQFMYGAPEYGGNRRLVGWTSTDFEGDVQPRGYTDREVTDPPPSSPLDLAGDLLGAPLSALGSAEVLHGVLAASGGTWSGMQAALRPLGHPSAESAAALAALRRTTQEVLAGIEAP